MKSHNLDDTIVAISTAIGQGAIGIVRLSGNEALTIADGLFFSNSGKKPSEFKNFTVHYGWVMAGKDKIIDEALLTVMRAPKSYTKEDMVEISCHGGIVSVRAILTCALDLGARLAEPGEFTKRAFLNGRIDLAQAEAVLDIIQSKTEDFLRVSTSQLKGELSAELESIREQLMNAYIEIEAFINFPEDDINAAGREKILSVIETAKKRVEKLLLSSEQGRILKEGIKVVICGRPNVGKSSLLNVLLKTHALLFLPSREQHGTRSRRRRKSGEFLFSSSIRLGFWSRAILLKKRPLREVSCLFKARILFCWWSIAILY